MTRPGIVRADTIDLQPQHSPSAQDHSRKPQGSAPGSHQISELRHVQDERHGEEEILSNAWSSAGNGLSDEPPSDDEQLSMRDDQLVQQNGKHSERHDDSDVGDSGDDSMDDDMMDKISSSPSISDGGYSHSVFPWPARHSSRHTPTPPRQSANQQPERVLDDADSATSSPFVTTPAHLPITLSTPRPASPFPFRSSLKRMRGRPTTPTSEAGTDSSSPFIDSPKHFPLHLRSNSSEVRPSSYHHRQVESPATGGQEYRQDKYEDERYDQERDASQEGAVGSQTLLKAEKELDIQQGDDFYQQPSLIKSASDLQFEQELLPVDDPLLYDDVFSDVRIAKESKKITKDEDNDWETESETKYSQDSFSSAGYNSDDDANDRKLPADERFIDSGWGGECLREIEDIDFEFVYALHTFVATVEGQANAQKGDTMVLLDDSNSYWWLVRVVKDSTIGYLPAEHIETPTERLARLNKHRNVDLSQVHLGDTTEKSKNPLKKAMRRRNAKTVTFSAPTYVEPSEYEYSTDEDSGDEGSLTAGGSAVQEQTKEPNSDITESDEISTVAPLSIKQVKRDSSPDKKAASEEDGDQDRRKTIDESRTSDEDLDNEFSAQSKSRNGTVRNTDSFFRDESIETRKITLTPNILRDENGPAFVTVAKTSLDRGPSLELLEKDPKDKSKGDKKKEKKAGGGMLSSIFKRGSKKTKGEDAASAKGKNSGETLRESPTSEENSPIERPGTADGAFLQRAGSKGKLQKSPPTGDSPTGGMSPAPLSTPKKVNPEPSSNASSIQSTPRSASPVEALVKKSSLRSAEASAGVLTGISNKLRHSPSQGDEAKPTKVKRAKTREALDVDSSPEDESEDPFADNHVIKSENNAIAPPGPEKLSAISSTERLSESPIHITTADAMPDNEPPALVGDSSSASSADELTSLRSSPSPPMTAAEAANARSLGGLDFGPRSSNDSSPPPAHPEPLSVHKQAPPAPTRSPPPQPAGGSPSLNQRTLSPARNGSTSAASSLSPAWSDANLRAYMDDPSDIKDLLLVVHDTSGVVPVGTDHPLMSNLYVEERGKVKEMNSALDQLLGQWLKRRKATMEPSLAKKSSTAAPAPAGGIGARLAGS